MKAVLVEKSPFLGGRTAQLGQVFPSKEDARELLDGLIKDVTSDPNITIYTNSQIVSGGGSLGDFYVTIEHVSRGCNKQYTKNKLEEAIKDLPQEIKNEFDYGLSNRRSIWMPYEGCWPPIPAIDWDNFNPEDTSKVRGDGFEFQQQKESTDPVACGV